jgi:hypothetical protein
MSISISMYIYICKYKHIYIFTYSLFEDGSSYEGQFKNDHIHGYVVYKNIRNEILGLYTGDVLKDEFAGRGRMIYTNKSKFNTVDYWKFKIEYHGMFKNNKRHGPGRMISGNFFSKNVIEGYWDYDVMIKEFKEVDLELNENLNDLICRICLENVSKFEVIAPCNCNGSQKWTHRYTLICVYIYIGIYTYICINTCICL